MRLATWDEYDRERALETKRAAYREVAGREFYANVNAKNGFGAYSGWQARRLRFRLERLASAEQVSAAVLS